MRGLIFAVIHLGAALAPLADLRISMPEPDNPFPGWPAELIGKALSPLPMTAKERGFSEEFPGKIGRFSDGSREIILRYVEHPTRSLHPSADCLRGSGYRLATLPLSRDSNGQLWGCALAERGSMRYRVCERIHDDAGNSWYDVSSWFWSAALRNSPGPWWAITIAERV